MTAPDPRILAALDQCSADLADLTSPESMANLRAIAAVLEHVGDTVRSARVHRIIEALEEMTVGLLLVDNGLWDGPES